MVRKAFGGLLVLAFVGLGAGGCATREADDDPTDESNQAASTDAANEKALCGTSLFKIDSSLPKRLNGNEVTLDWGGRVSKINGGAVEYNVVGRVTKIAGKAIEYNLVGRVSKIDGNVVEYNWAGTVSKFDGEPVQYDWGGRITKVNGKPVEYDLVGRASKINGESVGYGFANVTERTRATLCLAALASSSR